MLKSKSRSEPNQTTQKVNISKKMRDSIWALRYSMAFSGVALSRFSAPFLR
jgi:hypothetical protein